MWTTWAGPFVGQNRFGLLWVRGQNAVIKVYECFDFFHLDHARSKRKRRLIAHDPAHARPEGRGLRCPSPFNRPRACA